jgi:hypothetical protein
LQAFESLAVVASESMQHQSAAEIYRTFAGQFHRLSPPLKRQADDLLLRSLSCLGDHILTSELDAALAALREVLAADPASLCVAAIDTARDRLGQTVGQLHSRATRANAGEQSEHRRREDSRRLDPHAA